MVQIKKREMPPSLDCHIQHTTDYMKACYAKYTCPQTKKAVDIKMAVRLDRSTNGVISDDRIDKAYVNAAKLVMKSLYKDWQSRYKFPLEVLLQNSTYKFYTNSKVTEGVYLRSFGKSDQYTMVITDQAGIELMIDMNSVWFIERGKKLTIEV